MVIPMWSIVSHIRAILACQMAHYFHMLFIRSSETLFSPIVNISIKKMVTASNGVTLFTHMSVFVKFADLADLADLLHLILTLASSGSR
jgi:hypothetical protein